MKMEVAFRRGGVMGLVNLVAVGAVFFLAVLSAISPLCSESQSCSMKIGRAAAFIGSGGKVAATHALASAENRQLAVQGVTKEQMLELMRVLRVDAEKLVKTKNSLDPEDMAHKEVEALAVALTHVVNNALEDVQEDKKEAAMMEMEVVAKRMREMLMKSEPNLGPGLDALMMSIAQLEEALKRLN